MTIRSFTAEAPPAGADPATQLQWLVDRAAISDLIAMLMNRVDSRDFTGVAELFTDDAEIVLPFTSYPVQELPEISERIFERFEATHHMVGHFAVAIDGDTARSHQCIRATHLPDEADPARHADVGGWYDHEYRRTPEGWRISRYVLTLVLSDGIPFEPTLED